MVTVRAYHVTSDTAAERILADGFSDDTALMHPGIWFSAPTCELASLPASKRTRLLAVDADAATLDRYATHDFIGGVELPRDARYREWVVPAHVANRWPVTDLGHPDDFYCAKDHGDE
jgi:hypothetical protein